MRSINSVVVAAIAAASAMIVATVPAAARPNPGATASFEGTTINLAHGWGDAVACTADGYSTTCFRSDADMDAHLASGAGSESATRAESVFAACSTSLRLYDGTNYSTPVLSLSSRGVWTNLSSYGFDNRTSSYRVGACAAYFAENASGGGSWYPGNTAAGAQSSSMLSGWDNRVSSIYLT